MIDRGTVLRGFLALLAIAIVCSIAYVLLSDTEGTSGNFVEDGPDAAYAYGPIFEEPDAYRSEVFAARWIRDIPVSGGTFGTTLTKQIRIDIDGSGAIPEREVTLQTPAAVRLFAGPQRDRAEGVLHGIERILEERGGLLEGVSLTETRGGMESATIAAIVKTRAVDGITSAGDRAELTSLIQAEARGEATDLFAWYRGAYQEVVFGPEVSRGLTTWIRTPDRATEAQNIFTAYIVRHELEHAVTPVGEREYQTMQWLEEGGADAMARWPGAAAATARELGMPYPRRYDRVEFRTDRGGYPQWTNSVRILLGAAGVDWKDPAQLDEAETLIQEPEAADVPAVLAQRIATHNRLTPTQRARIERLIRTLDGSEALARAIADRARVAGA